MHPRKNFSAPLSGARRSISNRAPHLLTPALQLLTLGGAISVKLGSQVCNRDEVSVTTLL